MGLWNYVTGRLRFQKQFRQFASDNSRRRPELPIRRSDQWMRLGEDVRHLPFDAHYVYHTAWAARVLAATRPAEHVDISSYAYFATIVSAFIPVIFLDYRPAAVHLDNLRCGEADLCRLPFDDRTLPSLSCMHTIEHIGLGRYGDPLDPDGDCRALAELQRVLAPSGNLLVVVPVGQPRIQFNAHRIYDPRMIEQRLPELDLHELAVLPDDASGGLWKNPQRDDVLQQKYACGCFWFRRNSEGPASDGAVANEATSR
ncbi:MAG: DUF268 domain-containing protein [Planctomycetota bacterium]|nr:MAG: DUF268 domain-containing protein [Planctomycetota bacterium]